MNPSNDALRPRPESRLTCSRAHWPGVGALSLKARTRHYYEYEIYLGISNGTPPWNLHHGTDQSCR